MKTIYIDPGHGGSDPGATYGTRKEKDDVLCLAKLVKDKFANCEATVVLTRDTDRDLTIKERCNLANAAKADFFISLHRNSGVASATGNEIWIFSGSKQVAVDRATRILTAICNANGLKNRGVKKGAPSYKDFGVNRDTKMPAMLCEVGFITNAEDNAAYDTALDSTALALCDAICKEFGIQAKPQQTTNPVDKSENKVLAWQKAAIADGFRFPKYGADGKWGSECENVAIKAVCRYRLLSYKYPSLTRLVQKTVGVTVDGKFGKQTKAAVVAWQKSHGLTADGEVGLNTWKKMLGVS